MREVTQPAYGDKACHQPRLGVGRITIETSRPNAIVGGGRFVRAEAA